MGKMSGKKIFWYNCLKVTCPFSKELVFLVSYGTHPLPCNWVQYRISWIPCKIWCAQTCHQAHSVWTADTLVCACSFLNTAATNATNQLTLCFLQYNLHWHFLQEGIGFNLLNSYISEFFCCSALSIMPISVPYSSLPISICGFLHVPIYAWNALPIPVCQIHSGLSWIFSSSVIKCEPLIK